MSTLTPVSITDQIQARTAEYARLQVTHDGCSNATLKELLQKEMVALAQQISTLSASLLKQTSNEDDKKSLDSKYGSYTWIYAGARNEVDMVAVKGLDSGADSCDATIEMNRPLVAKRVMRYACSVLSILGTEYASKKLEATCTFDAVVPYWFPVVAKPLFKSIKIDMTPLNPMETQWKFSWEASNEYLNWWNSGGKAVCLKLISEDK